MTGRRVAFVLMAIAALLCGCERPEDRTANRIEALLTTPPARNTSVIATWPSNAPPLTTYVRFYLPPGDYDDLTLPLTTVAGPMPGWPDDSMRRVVVAVYILENTFGAEGRSAGRVHVKTGDLPQIFHGGCLVVNVIYDPTADVILGVWCNYDDRELAPAPSAPDNG